MSRAACGRVVAAGVDCFELSKEIANITSRTKSVCRALGRLARDREPPFPPQQLGAQVVPLGEISPLFALEEDEWDDDHPAPLQQQQQVQQQQPIPQPFEMQVGPTSPYSLKNFCRTCRRRRRSVASVLQTENLSIIPWWTLPNANCLQFQAERRKRHNKNNSRETINFFIHSQFYLKKYANVIK